MESIRSRTGVEVEVMDLHFQGKAGLIASYLIRHEHGAMIIESGPGSTVAALELELRKRGLAPHDVTHVLISHIHLDHAGAAGHLASYGAQIYVHPNGARHLAEPEKLLQSAARIYGEENMGPLWGEFKAVPEKQITTLDDGDEIAVGGVGVIALDTPGHAEHHLCYLLDDICFTGDVGGVRLQGSSTVIPPMPPPEFIPERWLKSLRHIEDQQPEYLAPTHYGIFLDPAEHLAELREGIDAAVSWADSEVSKADSVEELQENYSNWLYEWALERNLDKRDWPGHELINPSWMSALGLRRYWKKKNGK
ncbi:MBL fold metallo-hydrolase [Halorhodospira halochloris]|uniref:MBL fold metallo-hydrolase n=1 Tax=Halorhodospira halochloris TaxID=1052 RepID=UPI001EE7FAB4|nr:MBL fold metallo-hydrolase [Halorhodospira halochloris]